MWDLETAKYTKYTKKDCQLFLETTKHAKYSKRALRAGLHVDFNTKNTRRCVELFVTLGFAHEKPTHLRSM